MTPVSVKSHETPGQAVIPDLRGEIMIDRIIREPERRLITGRSTVSWWRDERAGKAPARVRLGDNAVGWRLSDITAWLESRLTVTPENAKPVAPGAKRGRPRKNRAEV